MRDRPARRRRRSTSPGLAQRCPSMGRLLWPLYTLLDTAMIHPQFCVIRSGKRCSTIPPTPTTMCSRALTVNITGPKMRARPLPTIPSMTQLENPPLAAFFDPGAMFIPFDPHIRIPAPRSHAICVRFSQNSVPACPWSLATGCHPNLRYPRSIH
jgi:hypothetical protein